VFCDQRCSHNLAFSHGALAPLCARLPLRVFAPLLAHGGALLVSSPTGANQLCGFRGEYQSGGFIATAVLGHSRESASAGGREGESGPSGFGSQ